MADLHPDRHLLMSPILPQYSKLPAQDEDGEGDRVLAQNHGLSFPPPPAAELAPLPFNWLTWAFGMPTAPTAVHLPPHLAKYTLFKPFRFGGATTLTRRGATKEVSPSSPSPSCLPQTHSADLEPDLFAWLTNFPGDHLVAPAGLP